MTSHSRSSLSWMWIRSISLLLWPVLVCGALLLSVPRLEAQTGGEAGIQGTVTDATGAVVPNATVTATDQNTKVATTRTATSDGLYTISPVLPGTYTVSVKAAGFREFVQKNLVVNALKLTGLNVKLQIGEQSAEVTVSEAPPALETTNATLGGVLENHTYENLPIQMNGQQRDPTAFATLLPGTVGGTRAPVIGGTGNFLAAVYVDGIPVFTINQQGDNRVVSNSIPVEAIDQFQVITSTPAAEYEGAGLINFTLHSGSAQYHGIFAAFVRNTIFDTWGFTAPALTEKNAAGQTVPAPKPVEHQIEMVGSGGGPIPFTHKKGFFYVTYDKYHGRFGINPNLITVPTALMRQGNFSELPDKIYDPTTTAACTAANGGTPCRYAFPNNTIPTNELSPIALKMQSYLPDPTLPGTVNNALAGVPSGYDNWEIASRVDYDLTARQRLSFVYTYGVRKNVPFTVGSNSVPSQAGVVLPLPYTAGGYATIIPTIADIEHNFQISNSMSNQFKFGFDRFSQPVESLTDNVAPYRATADFGITNLPAGQAADELPGATFSTNAPNPTQEATWTSAGASGATQTTVPNTFTLLDNFLWVKGTHTLTFGIQGQWLEDNVASQLGPSGIFTATYNANSTATFSGSSLSTGNSGFSYASYLLGAMPSTSIAIQGVSETGGRYHDFSPYFEDDWKVRPNLTLNLGLRWDYLQPFHEVLDRWSFLNPNLTNAATGNMGELEFAGNHGGPGVSCGCRTPVQAYMKNFGPRIGFSYQVTPRTVIRGGYGLIYSLGGGVGGRAGAGNGTGALGFNVNATTSSEITSGPNAGPSYYLNNSTYFQNSGLANTAYGGPGYTLPTPPAITAASQTLDTGNYVNSSGSFVSPSSIAYADPYLSGRAPEFSLFNFGFQQALSNTLTLTVNYAGTESHFLSTGSNARGYWADQLNPTYIMALGGVADSSGKAPVLTALATPANVAIVQKAMPGYKLPYASISAPNTRATIAQTLVAFPQYSGVSDTWGSNVANLSYNSAQVSLNQSPWHGLSYTINYTWSKNIGDDGTFRSGFALPAGAVDGGRSYAQDAIERAPTTVDTPQIVAAYGVWELPFGRGKIGGDNFWARTVAGGWQISTIYTFDSGTPLEITYGGCTAPNSGQCEPDFNPSYYHSPRMNGGYGKGVTAANLRSVQFIDPNAFNAPSTYTTSFGTNLTRIGDVARTAPYGLRNPYHWNDDISIRRTFPLHERLNFIFEVDALNVANHPTFTNINTAWSPGSTTFGTVGGASGNRDFQLAGRLTF